MIERVLQCLPDGSGYHYHYHCHYLVDTSVLLHGSQMLAFAGQETRTTVQVTMASLNRRGTIDDVPLTNTTRPLRSLRSHS